MAFNIEIPDVISSIPSLPEDDSKAACKYPAVARCSAAWINTLRECLILTQDTDFARTQAGDAYRCAMPPLVGARNTRDFIACVAHGMLTGAITSADGARLLYAAQVANGSRRANKSKHKKPNKAPLSGPNDLFEITASGMQAPGQE